MADWPEKIQICQQLLCCLQSRNLVKFMIKSILDSLNSYYLLFGVAFLVTSKVIHDFILEMRQCLPLPDCWHFEVARHDGKCNCYFLFPVQGEPNFWSLFRKCQKFELLTFFATKVGVGGRGCKLVCMFKLNARHNGNMKNIVSMATRASKLILLSNCAKT